jgi:hypothetical protein
MWPNPFFVKINTQRLPWKKYVPSSENVSCLCNFHKTAQNKQAPKRRKFAQSGHPVSSLHMYLHMCNTKKFRVYIVHSLHWPILPKMWSTYFCNFHKTASSKQSPNGRKFGESGCPGQVCELAPAKIYLQTNLKEGHTNTRISTN